MLMQHIDVENCCDCRIRKKEESIFFDWLSRCVAWASRFLCLIRAFCSSDRFSRCVAWASRFFLIWWDFSVPDWLSHKTFEIDGFAETDCDGLPYERYCSYWWVTCVDWFIFFPFKQVSYEYLKLVTRVSSAASPQDSYTWRSTWYGHCAHDKINKYVK